MDEMLNYVLSIISGLVVVIPVVVQLVKYVKRSVEERRWDQLMKIVLDLMVTAEQKFKEGADKKAYVMALSESAAANVGVDWDAQKVSDMIDAMVAMSKVVNAPEEPGKDKAVE